ncbi:MAG: hypothetical protein AAFU64_03255, partial [Bacteroidota bacterium]
ANNTAIASDRFLTNADYLRLRFLTLGYNVPTRWLEKTEFLRTARVFFQGENVFTASQWRGFDAEAQNNGSRIYPTPLVLSFGVELGI